MFSFRKEPLLKFVKILFPIVLLTIAMYEIKKTISGVDVNLLRYEVSQLQIWELLLIFIMMICAITPMIFYDVILVKIVGIKIRKRVLVKNSFIVNTFSNLIGFGGLVGIFLRNYFYSKSNEDKEGLLKSIASVTLFLSYRHLFINMDDVYVLLGLSDFARNTVVIDCRNHCQFIFSCFLLLCILFDLKTGIYYR